MGGSRRRGRRLIVEQAVFLVGGQGTRLQQLTADKAKPILEVGGRPFLDYLLEEAGRHGLKRALLLCGYRADDIVDRLQGAHHPRDGRRHRGRSDSGRNGRRARAGGRPAR